MFTGEIYPAEVDVLDGFVVRVCQTGEHSELPAKSVYDGQGRYLIPGYIDTHMHVESTMMIPENLSRAILPWGTTTICTDPHEIGNVMGVEGIRFMLGNAKKSALRQYVLAPSCVPAVPELESTGASFGAKEVGEILDMDDVVGTAEIMDFVGVYQDGDRMHSIIDEGIKRGMYLQGHAPYVSGKELAAYRLGGPCSNHESATAEEVVEKLRCGIHVNLRASSLIDNLKTLVAGCRNHQWKDMVSICTDDVHAKDLLTVGHINKVVRKAVQAGISGCEAIKLATSNAAREYGFDDLGAVAPGYIADMQIVDTLDGCQPAAVFVEGQLVAENGAYTGPDHKEGDYDFPNTVNIPQIYSADDFRLKAPKAGDTVKIQVIVPRDGNRILRDTQVMELPVKDGYVDISGHPDLVYVTVINRYGTGTQTTAIYKYFSLARGALASTISHDSHNLTVAYRDPKDAYLAAGTLRECAGGVCIVDNGEAATLPLPVAGLMSQMVCADVAAQIEAVQKKLDTMTDGTVTLLATAIMALPVLPGAIVGAEATITDCNGDVISKSAILVMCALVSGLVTILMAFYANMPFALSTGMGTNFLLGAMIQGGTMSFGSAMVITLISGVVFVTLTVLGLRDIIVRMVPKNIKTAISASIGFFIAFFGDFFSTLGTVLGVAGKAKMLDKDGNLPGIQKPFLVDAIGTCVGACTGNTTITTFVESTSGVEAGGRTGLTALTTGIMFLLTIFAAPLFMVIPYAATGPALIFVGFLMIGGLTEIDFSDFTEAFGPFMMIVFGAFTAYIAASIGADIIAHIIIKVFTGKAPGLYILCIPMVLYFIYN